MKNSKWLAIPIAMTQRFSLRNASISKELEDVAAHRTLGEPNPVNETGPIAKVNSTRDIELT